MDSNEIISNWKKAWDNLEKQDAEAKAKGTLVGRYITEPYADGHAVYRIIKENKKTIRMEVVTGIGDDWCIPYWGPRPTINREYVLKKLRQKDAMRSIFS